MDFSFYNFYIYVEFCDIRKSVAFHRIFHYTAGEWVSDTRERTHHMSERTHVPWTC